MQAGTMQEADLTHSWVTSFSPPVPCESAAGTEGSAVYWDGLATINAVYKKFQLPGWYTELPDCGAMAGCKGIWERQKYPYKKSGMNPNWEANLAELIQALKPFVANGSITGVFLGDELVVSLHQTTTGTHVWRGDSWLECSGGDALMYAHGCATALS
jgi:hypothetical protein